MHPAQHLPVEVRRPCDVVADGRGRVEGDGGRIGDFVGGRERVRGTNRRQAGRGRVDGGIGGVGRISRGRIAVLLSAHQQDRPDRRFLGLGDAL